MQYVTTDKETWHNLKPLARNNRNELTFAEKRTWNFIRKNQLGVKFRRQQVIANFIVDFVCLELKLIIEIDGESHTTQQEYDQNRTNILEELGYKVIRFANEKVIEQGNLVEEEIRKVIADLKGEKG